MLEMRRTAKENSEMLTEKEELIAIDAKLYDRKFYVSSDGKLL